MSENIMYYRGYTAQVEYSAEDRLFTGHVVGLKHNMIDFEGESVSALTTDFHNAIEFYLQCCAEEGTDPERPAADLDLRLELPSDIHDRIARQAEASGQSLNQVIIDALQVVYPAKGARRRTAGGNAAASSGKPGRAGAPARKRTKRMEAVG